MLGIQKMSPRQHTGARLLTRSVWTMVTHAVDRVVCATVPAELATDSGGW